MTETQIIEVSGHWLITDEHGINKVRNKNTGMYVMYSTQQEAIEALRVFGYEVNTDE